MLLSKLQIMLIAALLAAVGVGTLVFVVKTEDRAAPVPELVKPAPVADEAAWEAERVKRIGSINDLKPVDLGPPELPYVRARREFAEKQRKQAEAQQNQKQKR